jgi:hypothetical protein
MSAGTPNLVAIEFDADTDAAGSTVPWRRNADDVASAQPIGGRLAGDFFGHAQENLDGCADGKGRFGGEENAVLGKIFGLGGMLFFRNLETANAKRSFEIVTAREAALGGREFHWTGLSVPERKALREWEQQEG